MSVATPGDAPCAARTVNEILCTKPEEPSIQMSLVENGDSAARSGDDANESHTLTCCKDAEPDVSSPTY